VSVAVADPDGGEPEEPDDELRLASLSPELSPPPEERAEPAPSDEPALSSEPEVALPVTDPEPDPEPP
jgi:hypothetical protein